MGSWLIKWKKISLFAVFLPFVSLVATDQPPKTTSLVHGEGLEAPEVQVREIPDYLVNRAKPKSFSGFKKLLELTGPTDQPMIMPTDLALGLDNRLYVVDSGNNRILVFAADGKYLLTFGSPGEADGQLIAPVGITTAADGSVLVADRGNKRVQVFDSDGKFLKSIPTYIGERRVSPVDVALDDTTAYLYVTISGPDHKVLVYNNKGEVETTWGQPGSNLGEFRYPASIVVSQNDYVYVVDVFNSRVQAFDFSGKAQVTVGSWGVIPGKLFRPKGVTIRKDGLTLVSDSYLGVIQLFNSDTRFRAILGNAGEIAYFDTPTGLVVDDNGRLYVTEMLANRVTVLQLEQ